MSDIFDGKESKMSYIMQDFLQVRVNDVVRGWAGIVNKTKVRLSKTEKGDRMILDYLEREAIR